MALSIPVTWSEMHRLHAPQTAVWVGVPIDADELPERADRIRAALESAGARVVGAEPHDDAALLAVHDAGLVEFLRRAWADWKKEASRTTRDSGTSSATSSPLRGFSAAPLPASRPPSRRERAPGASTR